MQRLVGRGLRRAGWVPRVVAYVGYGLEGEWVRVLARVVLVPEGSLAARHPDDARGWRRFVTQSAAGVPGHVEVGGVTHPSVESDREGYVDVRLPADLPAGLGHGAAAARRQHRAADRPHLRIVAADARHGLVSDVDDTVMVTMLPRPLVAFRNAFVSREVDRLPVPGMAGLYRDLLAERPTRSWSTSPPAPGTSPGRSGGSWPATTTRPVRRCSPTGAPRPRGWFRSGQRHKTPSCGDCSSTSPSCPGSSSATTASTTRAPTPRSPREHPGRVDAVLIRQLSLPEQVVRYGRLDGEADEADAADDEPSDSEHPGDDPAHEAGARRTGRGDDGDELTLEARRLGLLD